MDCRVYNLDLTPCTVFEEAADQLIRVLTDAGCTAFRVGGAVRDRLLGRCPKEVDVATDAPPARVRELFPATYAVGESFGVIIVHTPQGVDIEVATFREDQEYADGRRPATVNFSTAGKDAKRRDFSINALFYCPLRQVVYDYANGLEDLHHGVIRAIGDPEVRFAEDHLRLLRAVRFSAALGFELAPETRLAISRQAPSLRRISQERVATELTRMLTGPRPAVAFRLLAELGLLPVCLPEVQKMMGVAQPPEFHPEGDVWQHTLLMLEALHWPNAVLAWAVLLHDVGKPLTYEFTRGRERFPKHADVGSHLAGVILRRLRFSRRFVEQVMASVQGHMNFMHVQDMRAATLRRMLARPTFAVELELHRLDCRASHGKLDGYCFLIDKMVELSNRPELPSPLLRGQDILREGVSEGPEIGRWLRLVQDWQLSAEVTTHEEALARLRRELQ